jgi:hypothetical protein
VRKAAVRRQRPEQCVDTVRKVAIAVSGGHQPWLPADAGAAAVR